MTIIAATPTIIKKYKLVRFFNKTLGTRKAELK